MITVQPKLRPHHQEITDDHEVVAEIVRAVQEAVRRARDTYNTKRPLNDHGMQRYGNVVENLTDLLSEFGFGRNDIGCQVRLECEDPDRYEQPIRILACKGTLIKKGDVRLLKVNPKGSDGRRLVVGNSTAWGRQLSLLEVETEGDSSEIEPGDPGAIFKNFWVCWEIEGRDDDMVLTIHVALPEALNKTGTVFDCGIECHTVWSGKPFEVAQSVADLPQGPVFTPVVEEHDEDAERLEWSDPSHIQRTASPEN
ncbi:MAG: hypothetical protein H8F28_19070 [Fibrella sp.]|nr:hypothetical protein [Armatimonadota bacterium]